MELCILARSIMQDCILFFPFLYMLYAFFCAARSQGGAVREYIKKSRESNHSGLHFDQPRGQA